jgi:hypothetical protein
MINASLIHCIKKLIWIWYWIFLGATFVSCKPQKNESENRALLRDSLIDYSTVESLNIPDSIFESMVLKEVLPEIAKLDFQMLSREHPKNTYNKHHVGYMHKFIEGKQWFRGNLMGDEYYDIGNHVITHFSSLLIKDNELKLEEETIINEFKKKSINTIMIDLKNTADFNFFAYERDDFSVGNWGRFKDKNYKSFTTKYNIADVYKISRIAFNKNRTQGILYYEFHERGTIVIIKKVKHSWIIKVIEQDWIS